MRAAKENRAFGRLATLPSASQHLNRALELREGPLSIAYQPAEGNSKNMQLTKISTLPLPPEHYIFSMPGNRFPAKFRSKHSSGILFGSHRIRICTPQASILWTYLFSTHQSDHSLQPLCMSVPSMGNILMGILQNLQMTVTGA
jgi:hypothetical protein